MLLQRINRTDPEQVFIIVKNTYGTATLTNGQPVSWDYTTDADGIGVTLPVAAESGFQTAGIIAESIAAAAYGLCQVYGYHSAAIVRTMTATGSIWFEQLEAVAVGTMLVCGQTAAFCLEGITKGTSSASAVVPLRLYPCAFALAAQASYTTKAIAVFIKGCL